MRPLRTWAMGILVALAAVPQAGFAASLCTGGAADLVIVTTSDIASAFDGYMNTKNAAGIATRRFLVEDITANYSGADTAEKIRNFLIDAYATWSISYVLLGGDETRIPIKTYSGINDIYYYNYGSNPFSGGATVLGGRLPGKSLAQARKIADQWANYDGQAAWTKKILYCSWASDSFGRFNDIAKFQTSAIPGENINIQICNAVNTGQGMVAYYGHGWEGGWATAGLNYVNVQTGFTNGAMLPYVIAGACRTGMFDHVNSFAEAIFEPPAGGAIAYVGANRDIYDTDVYSLLTGIFGEFKASYYDHGRVKPSATFHLGANRTLFNYLGDPAAEMDFRMPGDVTPPAIASQQLGPAAITAYQKVSCYATVTDNDEVSSHVWLEVTLPDASQVNWDLSRMGSTAEFTGIFQNTSRTGSYACTLHARDISGNETVSPTPLQFTVQADVTPPVVSYLEVTPTQAGPHTTIAINAAVTDDSGAAVACTIEVLKPDATTVTQTGWSSWWFDQTQLPGRYKVRMKARDLSGNETGWVSAVNVAPDYAFEILGDTTAPVIAMGWIMEGMGMFPLYAGDKRLSAIAAGNTVKLCVDAEDNMTPDGWIRCQADVRAPSGAVTRVPDFFWGGGAAYPPGTGYFSGPVTLNNGGFHSVTVYACDQVGNTRQAYAGRVSVYTEPTGLTANAISHQVNLGWVAGTSGYPLTGYNIFRSTTPAGNTITPVNASPVAVCAYQDSSGLVNGTTYYYTVAALDSEGNTCGMSSEIAAVPQTGFVAGQPPLTVSASAGDRVVQLGWNPGVPGSLAISGYNIYRGVSSGAQASIPLNASLVTACAYTDASAANGIRYYYKIRSQDSGGHLSALSVEVSAQPQAVPPTPTPVPTAAPAPAMPAATPTRRALDFRGRRLLAYPNPGREQVTFAWAATDVLRVTIVIYNASGERIAALGADRPGTEIVWDCRSVAAGVYFYQAVVQHLEGEETINGQKIAVVR